MRKTEELLRDADTHLENAQKECERYRPLQEEINSQIQLMYACIELAKTLER